MAYIKILIGSFVDVQHAKQLLQSHEIEPIVKDRVNSALIAGFGAIHSDNIELFVHEDEQKKALEIISKI